MQGTQNILDKPTTSSISNGNKIFINQDDALKQIDYDALATAILNKLSSQNFSSLSTSAKTVLGAVNELNSKTNIELIGSVELTEQGSSNRKALPYSTEHKMLYIECGLKNGYQVYGGSNINIYANSSRPCFVPIYADENFAGIIYIYNNIDTDEIVVYNYNISTTVLIRVYAYV